MPVPCASTTSTSSADKPRVRERLRDHPLLGGTVRRRQPIARAVLVDGAAPHHRQHPMTETPRIGQPLQQHHTHTLAKPVPSAASANDLQRPSGASPR